MNLIFNFEKNKFEEQEGISYLANNFLVALLERVMKHYSETTSSQEMYLLFQNEINNIKSAMKTFGKTPNEMLSDAQIEFGDAENTFILRVTNQNEETDLIEIEL